MLILATYLVLRTEPAQRYLTQRLNSYLSDLLSTKVEIEGIDISFFDAIELKNLYIEDDRKDTLLYAKTLVVNIGAFHYDKNSLFLRKIRIDNLKAYMKYDTAGRSNFDFIIEQFTTDKPDTTASAPFHLACKTIDLRNLHYKLTNDGADTIRGRMNFEALDLDSINFLATKFTLDGDSVSVLLDNLSLKEKSGLRVNSMRAALIAANSGIQLHNFELLTPNSAVKIDSLHMHTQSWGSLTQIFNEVIFETAMPASNYLGTNDLNTIIGKILPANQQIAFGGQILGPLNNISFVDFSVGISEDTRMQLSGNIFGLPEIENAFWNINFEKFSANIAEVEAFIKEHTGKLPPAVRRLSELSFDGKIVGVTKDIVAEVSLNSPHGNVTSDLKFKIKPGNQYQINGSANVRSLDLGYILENKSLSKLYMTDTIALEIKPKSFSLVNRGIIDSIGYGGYTYKNIALNGKLHDLDFQGNVSIKDPNITFNLDGLIQFNSALPKMKFEASAKNIDFVALKIDTASQRHRLAFDFTTNLQGNNLDNLDGNLAFRSLAYENQKNKLKFDTLGVILEHGPSNTRQILINSDFFSAFIDGRFSFTTLDNSIRANIVRFFPSLLQTNEKILSKSFIPAAMMDTKHTIQDSLQYLRFEVALNNIRPILKTFAPEITIADGTNLSGSYNRADNLFRLEMYSDSIVAAGQNLENLNLDFQLNSEQMGLKLSVDTIIVSGTRLSDIGITANSKAFSNTLNTNLKWNNKPDSINFSGNLNLDLITSVIPKTNKMRLITAIQESSIRLDRDEWLLQKSQILIDTSSIIFDKFRMYSQKQSFDINGSISENPNEELNVGIKGLRLNAFNPLLKPYMIQIGGVLSGDATLKKLYTAPLFFTTDSVTDFNLNGVDFGKFSFTTNWDPEKSKLFANAFIKKTTDSKPSLQLSGYLNPDNSELNFNLELFKFDLKFANPFLEGIASDLDGMTSGNISIGGTTDKPKIDGVVGLRRASIKIDYLQTYYSLQEDSIRINNKEIGFKKAYLLDRHGHLAEVDALISHDFFSDIKLDIRLKATNFQVLNTKEKDNDMFYGTAFVTGNVSITGPLENMLIDVQAKSERNTKIAIPLSSTGSVETFNFIQFSKPEQYESDEVMLENNAKNYEVDLSGLRLRMDLDVTRDAEMQIIMDKKVGDVIKSTGDGAISIDIDTKGKFSMYGEYVIEKGEYLFTLKNLINKKFVVNKGGTIKWNGDPLGAKLDLQTVYKLKKVPLKDFYHQDEAYKDKKVPIDCGLELKGSLFQPVIKFNIAIIDPDTRINDDFKKLSEEEMNKQFLSLIVMNKLMPLYGDINTGIAQNTDLLSSNATELLSNQLSVWLSQISDDWDIDVKYTTGDAAQNELELGVSTELSDRLAINVNGNLNVGNNSNYTPTAADAQSNGFEGDYELNYKLTRNGRTRLKYYGRANQVISYKRIPFMQGVGVFYREDFDNFGELFTRYWRAILNKKDDDSKIAGKKIRR